MSVWISVFSKEKVCHENWCPYARRIRYKNREKMSEERAVPPIVGRRDGVPAGQAGAVCGKTRRGHKGHRGRLPETAQADKAGKTVL